MKNLYPYLNIFLVLFLAPLYGCGGVVTVPPDVLANGFAEMHPTSARFVVESAMSGLHNAQMWRFLGKGGMDLVYWLVPLKDTGGWAWYGANLADQIAQQNPMLMSGQQTANFIHGLKATGWEKINPSSVEAQYVAKSIGWGTRETLSAGGSVTVTEGLATTSWLLKIMMVAKSALSATFTIIPENAEDFFYEMSPLLSPNVDG